METETLIETPDGKMRTFVVLPDGEGPFPVAIIYQDAVGVREELREIARRYSRAGYYTVLPDLYHALGENVSFDVIKAIEEGPDGEERKRLMAAAMQTTPERTEGYTRAILDYVGTDGAALPDSMVCLGFCMGARIVLHTLATFADEFVAGSGIHPGPLVAEGPESPHLELARVRGELYFGFAENDDASAPELLSAMEAEARSRGVPILIEVYPGTYHGFAIPGAPIYDAEASERHFERTLELWDRHTAAEPAAV